MEASSLLLSILLILTFSSQFEGVECELSSSSSSTKVRPGAPALYVFGDSSVDSGNNNWLPSSVKCNFLPYGINFPGGIPTGRATDGKTFTDFIADYLGLPYPPPHKRPDNPKSLTGYNYASGGTGIVPESCPFGCVDLDTQVIDFETTVKTVLESSFNSKQLSQHLSNSIYIIWVGTNDYLLNYFWPTSNASSIYNPQQFAQLLVDRFSQKIEILYNLGARKLIVLESIPLGDVPYYRIDGVHNNDTAWDENVNQNITLFNERLGMMIQHLKYSLPHAHITLGKSYQLSVDAFTNPSNYGLSNVRDPCCVLGERTPICEEGEQACPNPQEYYFWDGIHPSQAAFSLMAAKCINDSSFCFPYSVQHLLQL